MVQADDDRQHVEAHGTFAVGLTPPTVRWHYDVAVAQPTHQSVLRPLLRIAAGCFAYGIRPDGRVWAQCSEILKPSGRRYTVNLSGDPVTGFPLLWNVVGGERDSIVILATPNSVDVSTIFPHCYCPRAVSNFRSAHNNAAIECARKHVTAGGVAFLLPRNNGIEWMNVFAPPKLAVAWFDAARRLCKRE